MVWDRRFLSENFLFFASFTISEVDLISGIRRDRLGLPRSTTNQEENHQPNHFPSHLADRLEKRGNFNFFFNVSSLCRQKFSSVKATFILTRTKRQPWSKTKVLAVMTYAKQIYTSTMTSRCHGEATRGEKFVGVRVGLA